MRSTALPAFASIADTVRLTGLGRATLYELIASGDLAAHKIGRRTLVASAIAARPRSPKQPTS